MNSHVSAAPHRRGFTAWVSTALMLAVAAGMAVLPTPARAIGTFVDLGNATSFAVLGGQSVTNTGPSTITGDVGVSPGSSVTGLTPSMVDGEIHSADKEAQEAQASLTTAYNKAAGQPSNGDISGTDLGGTAPKPGVYNASSSIGLTGTLTLDAGGDPNAVWIFQIGSTLTTASNSSVLLTNGAAPCNVFWQIGSSATLGTGTTFVGNILASTSITATTGATIDGRALAQTGSVTLDTNTITRETCSSGGTTGGTTGGTAGGATGGTAGGTTGGTAGGTTGGTTGGTAGGTTGGAAGGGTGGATGGGHFHGHHHRPIGGVAAGFGGGARGPNATEITVGAALIALSLSGAGVFVLRRRARTASS